MLAELACLHAATVGCWSRPGCYAFETTLNGCGGCEEPWSAVEGCGRVRGVASTARGGGEWSVAGEERAARGRTRYSQRVALEHFAIGVDLDLALELDA